MIDTGFCNNLRAIIILQNPSFLRGRSQAALPYLRSRYVDTMCLLEKDFRAGMPVDVFSDLYHQLQIHVIRSCYSVALARMCKSQPRGFSLATSGSLVRGLGGFPSDIDTSFCYKETDSNYCLENTLKSVASEAGIQLGSDPNSGIVTFYFMGEEINAGLLQFGLEPITDTDKLGVRLRKMHALFEITGQRMIKDTDRYLCFGQAKTSRLTGQAIDFPMFWELYCDIDFTAGNRDYFQRFMDGALRLRRDMKDILHEEYVRTELMSVISAIEAGLGSYESDELPPNDEALKKTFGYEYTHQFWCIVRHLFDIRAFSDYTIFSDPRVQQLLGEENSGRWVLSMKYFVELRNALRLTLLDSSGLNGPDRYLNSTHFPGFRDYYQSICEAPLSRPQIRDLEDLLRKRGTDLAQYGYYRRSLNQVNLALYQKLLEL